MRSSTLLAALLGACSLNAQTFQPRPRNYDTHDYYALHLDESLSPEALAKHLGLEHDGPLGVLDHHHIFKAPKHDHDIVEDAVQELKRRRRRKRDDDVSHILDSILLSEKQLPRKKLVKRGVIPAPPLRQSNQQNEAMIVREEVAKRLDIQDPIFNEQWHVFNTLEVGHDLNVTGVWMDGITGRGATVCIVDDGLDMDSDDLKPNYFAKGSYDFNDHVEDPKPRLSDDQHGTRCAGEVAAAKNDVCGVGVAYDSRIAGIRILSAPISDIDEAQSIVYGFQDNDIYSCSWGPPDDGRTMEAPGILIKRAIVKAVQEGRGGKGTIYVFAAGNGAASDDNCNFDGYTNSIYSITVGAIDKTDNHPYYSEMCSAQLVVTYSSGAGEAIHTTDVGANKCTRVHGGTSAAGPLGSGVFALALSARPELTWRDMQWLTVMTAIPIEAEPNDWQTTATGKKFSHQFGYGKLDAWQIVQLAKTWKLVKPQAWLFSPWMHVQHDIPEGDQGLVSSFTITKEAMEKANLAQIEHVTVTMNIQHSRRGDLSAELHSPSGVISYLSTARRNDEHPVGYQDWTFMSVAHFGEDGVGEWKVIVKDHVVNDKKGFFQDWKLKLYGESINADGQALLPLPNADDDKDHDATTTIGATTTSVTIATSRPPLITPSHNPDRPVISKSTDASTPSIAPSILIPSGTGTSPIILTPTPEPEKEEKPENDPSSSPTSSAASPSSTPTSSADHSSFLPSPFPTFGLKKSTQIWVYGALALILIFCATLATYLFLQRRKRLRNDPRSEIEFTVLNDNDEDGGGADGRVGGRHDGVGMNGGAGGGKKPKKRAGELYDAFAGESDEDGLFSDDDEGEDERGRYRDEDEKLHGVGGDSD